MKRVVYIILPLLSKGVLPGAWHHGLVVAKLFLGFFFLSSRIPVLSYYGTTPTGVGVSSLQEIKQDPLS